jgi:pimeloyl-ACP methyl ester carboxylesterase
LREPLVWREYGAGAPLLLVHGDFNSGGDAWSGLIGPLASRRRLLIVDRRGHGASPREPRPYTIADDAADLIDVLDRAGVEAAHVVGHSYGGLVAIELAVIAPGRVRSLHLLEPPWLALAPDDPDVRALDRAVRGIRERAPEIGPEGTADVFFRQLAPPAALAALQASPRWSSVVREAARFADGEYGGDYPSARLARIGPELPVVVYRGGRSHPGLQAIAAEIANRLPQSRLVTAPEAGHAVQQSEAFVAMLLDATEPDDDRDEQPGAGGDSAHAGE